MIKSSFIKYCYVSIIIYGSLARSIEVGCCRERGGGFDDTREPRTCVWQQICLPNVDAITVQGVMTGLAQTLPLACCLLRTSVLLVNSTIDQKTSYHINHLFHKSILPFSVVLSQSNKMAKTRNSHD